MTAPHIGNTGVNDEDPESRPDLGQRATSCATRPGAPSSTGGRTRTLDDELAAQGVVGISGIDTRALTRHLRERGAMRVGVFSVDGDRRGVAARAGARRRRRWPAPTWPARSPRPSRTSSPAIGEQAVHRRRARPRHQGDDAAPDGRARHRGARAARDRRPSSERARDRRRRGVPLQRARRPGHRRPRGRADARTLLGRGVPVFGICFGNQVLGRALGLRHLQAAATATAASTSRCRTARPARSRSPRTTTASRSTRPLDGAVDDAVRRGRGQPRLPQRRRRRGAALPRRAGVLGAVPPGGRGRPARRRRTSSTGSPTCSRGRRADAEARPTSRSVLVIGSGPIVIGQACEFDYSGTQACRVLRDEGLRVSPGQLQPGHDHDRPGVRRRHLHRADHPGVRRRRSSRRSGRTRCSPPSAARPR